MEEIKCKHKCKILMQNINDKNTFNFKLKN